MTTRNLIWEDQDGKLIWHESALGSHQADIGRGGKYLVSNLGSPDYTARYRKGWDDLTFIELGRKATLAEAKALCEQHYATRA
jgi:hypothetical protein